MCRCRLAKNNTVQLVDHHARGITLAHNDILSAGDRCVKGRWKFKYPFAGFELEKKTHIVTGVRRGWLCERVGYGFSSGENR